MYPQMLDSKRPWFIYALACKVWTTHAMSMVKQCLSLTLIYLSFPQTNPTNATLTHLPF